MSGPAHIVNVSSASHYQGIDWDALSEGAPKNIVVYEPGTQPGRLKANTPNIEMIPPKP